MKKYIKYHCADFASDQAFIDWVRNPDSESDVFWAELMKTHPELNSEIADARLIVQSMRFEEQDLSRTETSVLWQRIEKNSRRKNPVIRRMIAGAACAASVALLFGIWYQYLYNEQSYNEQSDELIQFANSIQDVARTEVQVVLADNTNYNISETNADLKYTEEGRLTVNNSEKIEQLNSSDKKEEVKYNRIIVPWGKRSVVTFADGTKMWLNSGSRAVYPVSFAENKREIFIEGEAYFEVAKDVLKPFIVKTGNIEIKVLGTSFNISAYQKEENTEVALVAGSVEVQQGSKYTKILPNQAIKINKNTFEQTVVDVDIYDYIAWKDGFLQFNSEKLERVLRKVERHYAVQVMIELSLDDYSISGKLDLKDYIEPALQIISKLAPIQYEIVNNEVFIRKQ